MVSKQNANIVGLSIGYSLQIVGEARVTYHK